MKLEPVRTRVYTLFLAGLLACISAPAAERWADYGDTARQLAPLEPTPVGESHIGIVESGVACRVFCPLQVLQYIKNGGVPWVSLYFVQLLPPPTGRDAAGMASAGAGYEEAVADALGKRLKAKVELKGDYRDLLYESFSSIYVYINAASGVALIVCFLIILLSMYTMVLERTREIGILKSLGAGKVYLIGESVLEALIVCTSGTILGMAFAFGVKYGLETARPLLTVSIEVQFLILAALIGVVGGVLSALYPGYRAARLDPVAALTNE